jgi:hypothetical protein
VAIHLTTAGVDPASVRVAVYWNLSRYMWSIKTDEATSTDTGEVIPRGKVIGWADAEPFALTGARFHVSAKQHATGLAGTGKRGTKRNVVAWVVGKLADGAQHPTPSRRVTFHWTDPRSVFHYVDSGEPAGDADVALFTTSLRDGRAHGQVFV